MKSIKPYEPHELRRDREAMGLTQEQLAELLPCSKSSVWNWENGERAMPRWIELRMIDIRCDYDRRMAALDAEYNKGVPL